MSGPIDVLANEIRRIDGTNTIGAGALAEALMPFIEREFISRADVINLIEIMEAALDHSNRICIEMYAGKRAPEAAEHYARIRAAIASIRVRP